MPVNKTYTLYGLTLSLPFEYPQLIEGSGKADVAVTYNPINCDGIEWKEEGICHKAAPGAYFLSLPGIADYFVRNGKEITIKPAKNADEEAIKVFLISAVMGALLLQREFLPLQGSCVVHNGKAYALLGGSAEGKSFMAAGLRKRGFRVLSENLCVLGNEPTPLVSPEYPYLLLWKKGLKLLEESSEGLQPVRKGLMKYYFPLGKEAVSEPTPLGGIYFIRNRNKEQFQFEELSGSEKLFKTLDFTYHEPLVTAMNVQKNQNIIAAKATKSVKVKRYTFLDTPDVFQQSIDRLAEDIIKG